MPRLKRFTFEWYKRQWYLEDVRLCPSCNLMLGHAKDDAEILLAAAEYLLTHLSFPEHPDETKHL